MMHCARRRRVVAPLSLLVSLLACTRTVYRADYTNAAPPPSAAGQETISDCVDCQQPAPASSTPPKLDLSAPFLKCHFKDGTVVVLESWTVDSSGQNVQGSGLRYTAERTVAAQGALSVRVADVALFETNVPEQVGRSGLIAMGVVSGASGALTALCISSPKTCFGSCPTFYGFDGERYSLQAEGFSSSLARALESTDTDALFDTRTVDGRLKLWLTNEAPETHAIRSLRVLSAPRPAAGRIYRAGERFFAAGEGIPPSRCVGLEGDCASAVAKADELEYLSRTDPSNLLTKETIDVSFEHTPASGELGLVIAARNGLLNSFLLYQAFANMGTRMGEYLAELERSSMTVVKAARRIDELLGDLEVEVKSTSGEWLPAGRFVEIGPIAREVSLLRLPSAVPRQNLELRLRQTRGNFKLDALAVVPLLGEVGVTAHEVVRVDDEQGEANHALEALRDPERYLVTQPGDAYLLEFEKPGCQDCEFFLEARGYYYEWSRDVWFAEEDEQALIELFTEPERAMVRLAPAYKRVETDVDRLFLESRVRTRMRPPGLE